MNDSILEEMADAISTDLHVDANDVLRILHRYWQDKIAPVWQVDELLDAALKAGIPITCVDAVDLLKDIFEDHDSELGITWMTLEVELQEYRLDWKRLPEERHNEVQGVFKVWRQGDPVSHEIGLFPNLIQGNLPKALTLARSMADERPDTPVLIGCKPRNSETVKAWLSVIREKDDQYVDESEDTCMP